MADRKDYNRKYYHEHKEQLKAAARAYHHANKEQVNAKQREYWKQYSQENRDRLNERARQQHQIPAIKARRNASSKKHYQE